MSTSDRVVVQSAALILVNAEGKFFCVRELMSKPDLGKVTGSKDYSVPWETVEGDERIWLTLHRAIVEEVDATDGIGTTFPVFIGSVPVHDTRAHVFTARYTEGPNSLRGSHAGAEIEPLGWLSREELLTRCRDGIPELLALWDQYQDECQCVG